MAMMEFLEQARRGDDYIRALEEERRKIEVFQRELPLCLQLITQAIESVRRQMSSTADGRAVSLKDITPLQPSPTAAEEQEKEADRPDGKPDWLRSVQLWNHKPGTVERPKKPVAVKLKKMGGAFQPFEREKYVAAVSSPAARDGGCSGGDDGEDGGDDGDGDCIIVDNKEKADGQSQPYRKTRRSWSPELHRRFLQALHQLGGSHVATPKQIKEQMRVNGLTNDEIKSHLQKYRLHHRRPSPAVSQGSNLVHGCPSAPQFVLIGGILVQPPSEYTAATVAAAAPSVNDGACAPPAAIYAPVVSPTIPQDLIFQHQQQQQNTRRSHERSTKLRQRKEEGKRNGDGNGDDDATNNVSTSSPATSASSHTTSILA